MPIRSYLRVSQNRGRAWGRFDVRFDRRGLLSLIAFMMNLRSRLTGIATGDQALFVTRAAFDSVGGFPSIALMEDIALSSAPQTHQPSRLHSRPRHHLRAPLARTRDAPHHFFDVAIAARILLWRGPCPSCTTLRLCLRRTIVAVSIAILAKAPVPGLAKTRLIPTIGAHAAAVLQERLTERAVATALAADVGPVTIWCAPDGTHNSFLKLVARSRITLRRQPEGDLGARMLAATAAGSGPTLVIGTDCPALTEVHLRGAANALRNGHRRYPHSCRGRRLCPDRHALGAATTVCRHRLGHKDRARRDTRTYHRAASHPDRAATALGRRYRERPRAP